MANTNIINAVFGSGICAVTTSAFRANYGMKLRFSGIELPTAFEVDFSNYDTMGRDSITMIGQNNEVQIPDQLWDSGLNIYAYVYLHPTDDSGVTVYTVTIPVLGRPNRTDEEPTPHEQTLIEQAISALNDAVEQTAADVVAADASATAAAQSEANASASERAAAASASAALASQNAAESAARSASESALGASESARNAAVSAAQAAESATSAQASAEQAERSVQSITDDVERAERAAQTATDKATEAASSAATASGKATEASASASAAAQSAQSASTAAQNAAESEQLAESHATDAEQAKQDAQDAQEAAEQAQAAAEQAAESVSGLSEQIEQNTADIADLVQSKAGALIDTVSGSIASFVPDATVPTVKGLTVDVEPVQSGSGDPSPDNIRPISGWDAVEVNRTGVNLFGGLKFAKAMESVAYAPRFSLDTVEKKFTFTRSGGTDLGYDTPIFTPKSPMRMTAILTYENTGNNSSIIFGFTDGTYLQLAMPNSNGVKTTVRVASTTGKLVKNVVLSYYADSPTTVYYDESGFFEGDVAVNDFTPYLGQSYTIPLGQTVYGGTIDATAGKMVVDRAMVDLGTLGWSKHSRNLFYTYDFTAKPVSVSNVVSNLICSEYKTLSGDAVYSRNDGISMWSTSGNVAIYDSNKTGLTTNQFKTAMSGVQLCYELATPITISLTPLEISVLTGQTNNIWADAGDVTVDYAADLRTYINNKIAAAVAALS